MNIKDVIEGIVYIPLRIAKFIARNPLYILSFVNFTRTNYNEIDQWRHLKITLDQPGGVLKYDNYPNNFSILEANTACQIIKFNTSDYNCAESQLKACILTEWQLVNYIAIPPFVDLHCRNQKLKLIDNLDHQNDCTAIMPYELSHNSVSLTPPVLIIPGICQYINSTQWVDNNYDLQKILEEAAIQIELLITQLLDDKTYYNMVNCILSHPNFNKNATYQFITAVNNIAVINDTINDNSPAMKMLAQCSTDNTLTILKNITISSNNFDIELLLLNGILNISFICLDATKHYATLKKCVGDNQYISTIINKSLCSIHIEGFKELLRCFSTASIISELHIISNKINSQYEQSLSYLANSSMAALFLEAEGDTVSKKYYEAIIQHFIGLYVLDYQYLNQSITNDAIHNFSISFDQQVRTIIRYNLAINNTVNIVNDNLPNQKKLEELLHHSIEQLGLLEKILSNQSMTIDGIVSLSVGSAITIVTTVCLPLALWYYKKRCTSPVPNQSIESNDSDILQQETISQDIYIISEQSASEVASIIQDIQQKVTLPIELVLEGEVGIQNL